MFSGWCQDIQGHSWGCYTCNTEMGMGESVSFKNLHRGCLNSDVTRIFALRHAYEIGQKLSKGEDKGRAPSAAL